MMREGTLQPAEMPQVGTTRGLALLQGVAMCALLGATAFVDQALYLAVPLALLVLWMPRLRQASRPVPVTEASQEDDLIRQLAKGTSHNALSAAAVAHAAQQLAARVQSQLGAAQEIVGSAEVMIVTERPAPSSASRHCRRRVRPVAAAWPAARCWPSRSGACTTSACVPPPAVN